MHRIRFSIALAVSVVGYAAPNAVTIRGLDPFRHDARVPAGAEISSIRLDRVKLVHVPTAIRTVNSPNCNRAQQFAEPGGSAYCPSTSVASTAEAYEFIYSYVGQPLASDEFGGRRFQFSVYFRPEELRADIRQKLLNPKTARALAGQLFAVNVSAERQQRMGVDQVTSRFCGGSYVDGVWRQANPDCKDDVRVKAVSAPAEYVTIVVSLRDEARATR